MKKLFFLILLSIVFSVSFSQSLKKGIKLIEKQDFVGAETHFNKTLSENSNDPSSLFGMGLVYSDSSNSQRNLQKAFIFINNAKSEFLNLDATAKTALSGYLDENILNQKYAEVDDEIYNGLLGSGDTVALNNFMHACPFSNYFDKVKQLRNDIVFEDVHSQNNIEAYNFYIENYSDSVNVAKAISIRNSLIFEQVKDSNNIQVYTSFINDYPDAEEVKTATDLLDNLMFSSVKDSNSVELYNNFIADHPDSKHISEVVSLRDQLEFNKAQEYNTIKAYQSFIKDYPDAEQISYAETLVKELEKWNCIPGMKVGSIVYNTSYDDLKEEYGDENLHQDSLIVDEQKYYGTVLYPEQRDKKLFIVWKNKKELKYPDRIIFLGDKWQTHKGVKIGSTMDDLMLFNGKEFELTGFRKKGEGTVKSWKGGKLGLLHIIGKNIFLQLSYDENKFFSIPEEGLLELTNSDYISTDNQYLKDIGLKVFRMEILFPE
jgi:hypothetical protein